MSEKIMSSLSSVRWLYEVRMVYGFKYEQNNIRKTESFSRNDYFGVPLYVNASK